MIEYPKEQLSPTLAKHRRRVTAKEQKVGKVKMHAPLGHLTPRWRKYALEGEKITSNYYEAAAFETRHPDACAPVISPLPEADGIAPLSTTCYQPRTLSA
jgi:hypothetical protein